LSVLFQSLIREDRLARLQLSRLQPEDVHAMARSLSPQSSDSLAEWLVRHSEGNPYILHELVREARSRGILGPDGTVNLDALPGGQLVPQTIYSLIQARLSRIDDPSRRVLDAAVAAGREFEFEVVARAAGLSELAALDALEMLSQAGLIHPLDGSRYAFDHSLIMEVAYREVGEARHRVLHRRIAEALEQLNEGRTGPVAGLIAWHFAEGNDVRRAAPYAYQAGQQAAGLAAWAEAVAFYEQALQGVDDSLRVPLWMALGEAHSRAGHFARASETFRDALQWARSYGKADHDMVKQIDQIELALAESLLTQARFAEIVEIAQRVLRNGRPESALQAQFLWGTALSLEGSDLDHAAEHLRLADAICAAEGTPSDEALVNTAKIKFELGSVLAQQGDLQGAVDLYLESLEAASQSKSEAALARHILAYNNLGYHLLLLGDHRAGEYARSGLELAEEKGYVGLLPYLLSTLGEIALEEGDLDGADGYFSRGLELGGRLNMPERVAGLTANLGLVSRERGQESLAIYRLSKALGQADALGTRHLAAQIRLWLAPLLPAAEGRQRLAEARLIAESTGRKRLLEEAQRLERLLEL
jgi:tetratricopeptide (TPR) repeat protein